MAAILPRPATASARGRMDSLRYWRRQFFRGAPAPQATRDDLDWYRPDGAIVTPQDWNNPYARAVTMSLSGATGDDGRPDDPFLLMLNAWWEPLESSVPEPLRGLERRVAVDTADPGQAGCAVDPSSATVTLTGRSLVLLRGTELGSGGSARPG